MTRRLLVLLAASGCRSLLGFEELAAPDGITNPDGPPPDGTPTSDGEPTDDAVLACPASYTLTLSGTTSLYRFVSNQSVTWTTANSHCIDDGTHLIVLSNEAELSQINVVAGAGERWVGLSARVTDATFLPVTDEPTTFPPDSGSPWAIGEPSNNNDQPCVAMNDNGRLITLSCGNGRNFICECDGVPDDPTNY